MLVLSFSFNSPAVRPVWLLDWLTDTTTYHGRTTLEMDKDFHSGACPIVFFEFPHGVFCTASGLAIYQLIPNIHSVLLWTKELRRAQENLLLSLKVCRRCRKALYWHSTRIFFMKYPVTSFQRQQIFYCVQNFDKGVVARRRAHVTSGKGLALNNDGQLAGKI